MTEKAQVRYMASLSTRINQGHAQFDSRPRLKKQVARKPTVQPMMKFSQLIFRSESRLESKV